jgi:hypothetical protein
MCQCFGRGCQTRTGLKWLMRPLSSPNCNPHILVGHVGVEPTTVLPAEEIINFRSYTSGRYERPRASDLRYDRGSAGWT